MVTKKNPTFDEELLLKIRRQLTGDYRRLIQALDARPGLEEEIIKTETEKRITEEEILSPLVRSQFTEDAYIESMIDQWCDEQFEIPNVIFKDTTKVIEDFRCRLFEFVRDLDDADLNEIRGLDKYVRSLGQLSRVDFHNVFLRIKEDFYDLAVHHQRVNFSPEFVSLNRRFLWGEYVFLFDLLTGTRDVPSSYVYDFAINRMGQIFGCEPAHLPEIVYAVSNLLNGLIEWANRKSLQADWVIEFLLDFLWQFNHTPEMPVGELDVPRPQESSLEGPPFEVRFRGWRPADEHSADFASEAKKFFDDEMKDYLKGVYRAFDLDLVQMTKKPVRLDRIKWLVRWNVHRWTAHQIAEEYERETRFAVSNQAIHAALREFNESYGFPVREGR